MDLDENLRLGDHEPEALADLEREFGQELAQGVIAYLEPRQPDAKIPIVTCESGEAIH